MSQKHEHQAAQREATLKEIQNAKKRLNVPPATTLARVALGVVYMYLIMMSYELLGTSGPVFISLVFLLAFFIPWGYSVVSQRRAQRRAADEQSAKEKPVTVREELRREA